MTNHNTQTLPQQTPSFWRSQNLRIGFCLCLFSAAAAAAQDLSAPPSKTKQYVAYASEPQTIAAGKRSTLELHFHVNDGFHVNSHTPKSELLLPTKVELDPAPGITASPAAYPPGKPYSFAIDPTEKLDVYSDDFIIRIPVTATSGPHELKGILKYQACNNAACYPPKVLPVTVLFTAK